MTAKLKPCPFCGGEPRFGIIQENDLYDKDNPNIGAEYIECSHCKTSTMLIFPLSQNVKEMLVNLWNQRQFESD